MTGKLWGARMKGDLAPEMAALSRSTHFDVRLVAEDCAVLAAHVTALAKAGLLSDADVKALGDAIWSAGEDIASGTFVVTEADEDIHSAVERALDARVPDLASRIRAGLSRNDRVATAFRLWVMRAGTEMRVALIGLIRAMVEQARTHTESIMPGYTHLQRAQPVTLGAVLAAHAHALARDVARLADALGRTTQMPLGAGALAGSTLGLDHSDSLSELGFESSIPNPIDAVAARDFAAEFLAVCAITGVHLSRIGEEIVLWTSSEFGYATIDDAFSTGSSVMPQKKNPDVAELARGKAGRLIGSLAGLLATLKGLPLAYNRDLQEDKEPVFDATDTLLLVLPALTGAIATMRFDEERMRTAASDPMLLATDLAERLVAAGMPFRDAHEAVGRAVRYAIDRDISLADLSPEEWSAIDPALADAGTWLDVQESIRARGVSWLTGLDALEKLVR